jgi:hypothetical protein
MTWVAGMAPSWMFVSKTHSDPLPLDRVRYLVGVLLKMFEKVSDAKPC